jgi:cytochrome c-type biogenesis protein CcmF
MLLPWAGLALGAAIAAFFLAPQGAWKVAAGVFGAVWIAAGTLRFVWTRLSPSRAGSQPSTRKLTAEMLGMTLAHTGVAVFLVGALLTEGLSQQRELAVTVNERVELGGYSFRFEGVQHRRGPNFEADLGTVSVLDGDTVVAVMHPEKRTYASGGQVMTEAAIDGGITRDLYVALGEPLGGGAWALRVHVKPFVRWIWAGALLMMLGGLVTAADKRFRVPRRLPVARPSPPDAAADAVPAPGTAR